jgi:DNA modification methylase
VIQTTSPMVQGADWTLVNGDCVEELGHLSDDAADLSIYSPPFIALYTYSATERDMGNCSTPEEFFAHFGFLQRELLRVTKPGRLTCVHVAQVPAMLARDGYIGLKDFRGQTIASYERNGWIYHGEVCIDKDPQAQAIRTKSKGLLFVQMKKDSSWSRPALADYILLFRKPGENPCPVTHPDTNPLASLSNDEWISWARPIWYGIRESDTLQVAEARADDDERHVCPLQLGTIERCVRLWSNPGDLVVSPFAGIGSEGYESVRLGRRFLGIELKPSYFDLAVKNLRASVTNKAQGTLFEAPTMCGRSVWEESA